MCGWYFHSEEAGLLISFRAASCESDKRGAELDGTRWLGGASKLWLCPSRLVEVLDEELTLLPALLLRLLVVFVLERKGDPLLPVRALLTMSFICCWLNLWPLLAVPFLQEIELKKNWLTKN